MNEMMDYILLYFEYGISSRTKHSISATSLNCMFGALLVYLNTIQFAAKMSVMVLLLYEISYFYDSVLQ